MAKKTLACESTDIDLIALMSAPNAKHATIRQQGQRSDPMAYRHRQIDSALIQWHTGIVRLTAL